MKKVAVIGSGISGTSAAYYLHNLGYDVSLFEAGSYFGGHTNTIDVEIDGVVLPVDTGFLVHNDRTYPNLIEFFNELKIKTHMSEMSFSVMRKSDNIMWAGNNILSIFSQFKNVYNPRFYKFLIEVIRFNKNSKDYLAESLGRLDLTLGDLLKEKKYSEDFQKWYLLPMGGCIWSSPTNEMLGFPAYTFLVFCMNHGLLQIFNRPKWKTVQNGCKTYVENALSSIDKKYVNEPVRDIINENEKVRVITDQRNELFDYCVVSTHPPETLNMLKNVNEETKRILREFKYQENIAVLHSDESVLPEKKIAWAAWNYLSARSTDTNDAVSVSYLINKLQPIPTNKSIIVTLNPVTQIDECKIYKKISYQHPLFSVGAIKAQEQMAELQGGSRLYFSGAWMRYGFHEDGILSSKLAIKKLLKDDKRDEHLVKIL